MKNFTLLDEGIETGPLLALLNDHPELWNVYNYRSMMKPAHKEVDDIIVRFDDVRNYTEGMECIDYPAWAVLGETLTPMLNYIMDKTACTKMGRVVITRLTPGHGVAEHRDTEKSVKTYRRYHLCIDGHPGNKFDCSGESVEMYTGQLWWFNNQILHSCINLGQQDRIHLIVDAC